MKKIVLILPTYNESNNIANLTQQIQNQLQKLTNYKAVLLIVDDNSPDGTQDIIKDLQKQHNNIVLLTGPKRGLGAAYVRGMYYAIEKLNADILFEMDADFSHDPKLIPQFIKELEKGVDFVIGSRYIKNGCIPQEWTLERKIYSVLGNLIVRFGLMIPKIKDWTSGYRALNKEIFQKVGKGLELYSGYAFQVAFLHKTYLAGFKISEIPLRFVDRKFGKSKIIPPEYIKSIFIYILTYSSFIKFLIVGTIGFSIQTVIVWLLINKIRLNPGVAVTMGAELAIISNFFLNQFWAFSHYQISGIKKLLAKFLLFNLSSCGAIFIQALAVTIGTTIFGRGAWFVFMVGSIIFLVIPYSYFIYSKFIWKKKT